jgi:hypothetical protein
MKSLLIKTRKFFLTLVVQPEVWFFNKLPPPAILDFEKCLQFLYYLTNPHQIWWPCGSPDVERIGDIKWNVYWLKFEMVVISGLRLFGYLGDCKHRLYWEKLCCFMEYKLADRKTVNVNIKNSFCFSPTWVSKWPVWPLCFCVCDQLIVVLW